MAHGISCRPEDDELYSHVLTLTSPAREALIRGLERLPLRNMVGKGLTVEDTDWIRLIIAALRGP